MRKFRNFLTVSVYALLLATSTGYAIRDPVQRKLDSIMMKQEEVMNIKYPAKPVLILKSIPEMPAEIGGIHWSGKIEINSSNSSMWGALAHELGHFYTFRNYQNEINDRLSKVSFSSKVSKTEKNVINYIAEEGVAAYFEYKTMGSLDCRGDRLLNLDVKKLRKGREEYGSKEFEELACGLVKPILDVNVDRGIETLIKNPMTREDLENLVGYQQRILKIVEAGKNAKR